MFYFIISINMIAANATATTTTNNDQLNYLLKK